MDFVCVCVCVCTMCTFLEILNDKKSILNLFNLVIWIITKFKKKKKNQYEFTGYNV